VTVAGFVHPALLLFHGDRRIMRLSKHGLAGEHRIMERHVSARVIAAALSLAMPSNAFAFGCNAKGSLQNPKTLPALTGKLVFQANDFVSSAANDSGSFFNHLYFYNFAVPTAGRVRIDPASWGFCNAINANFSPDGNWIAFTARKGVTLADCNNNVSQIYVYQLGSTVVPTNLFPTPSTNQEDPRFSPDGKSIVFKTARMNIAMAAVSLYANGTASAGPMTMITSGTVEHSAPFLSPTEKYVYYFESSETGSNIYRMNLATGIETMVTAAGYSAYGPVARDLSTVLYVRKQTMTGVNDQIYLTLPDIFPGKEYQLPINACDYGNSDPASVDENLVIFSRTNASNTYDIYLGNISNGYVWALASALEPGGSTKIYNLVGSSYYDGAVSQ
jgi:Tol biopolymer transport system component